MTITIPEWVLWLPVWYLLVGVVLTLPMLAWTNVKMISGRHPWHWGWHRWQAWVAGSLAWPFLIWEMWATPRRNRKTIEKWRAQGADW